MGAPHVDETAVPVLEPVVGLPDGFDNAEPVLELGFWSAIRGLWCRHPRTYQTNRTATMPPHVVCLSCGWREPVEVARPTATRTWDSSRDAARYERQKRRREALERRMQHASSDGRRRLTGRKATVIQIGTEFARERRRSGRGKESGHQLP